MGTSLLETPQNATEANAKIVQLIAEIKSLAIQFNLTVYFGEESYIGETQQFRMQDRDWDSSEC